MGSITKNYLDENTIRKIADVTWKQEELASYKEQDGGYCNAVYRLYLKSGKTAILKVAPATNVQLMSCEVEMMRTEAEAMQLARNSHISCVPGVFAYDDNTNIENVKYLLMENMEGISVATAKEQMQETEKNQVDRQIGKLLKQINLIKGKKFGHFCVESLQYDTWFEAFYAMLDRVILDGIHAGISIGISYDVILQKLGEHKKYFEGVTEPKLVHFDSWDGNFLMKDGKINAIIDWERALWAEGLMEDKFRFHSVSASFLQGYGIQSLTVSQQMRSYWYDIYLYLIMMFEVTYRKYETNEQYVWVHGLFEQVWEKLANI